MRRNKILFTVFAIIIGLGIAKTDLFAPIHEYGHLKWSYKTNISASFKDWKHTIVSGTNIKNVIGGYRYEMGFFFCFGFCVLIISTKLVCPTGGFYIGYLTGTLIQSYSSDDFSLLPKLMTENELIVFLTRWTFFWILAIAILLLINIIGIIKLEEKNGKQTFRRKV